MERYKAVTKFVRISPRKARLAAGLIRGRKAIDAQEQLKHSSLRGSRLLMKTLRSAVANAESRGDVRPESLIIKEVKVDEGPRMKRAKPRSKGMKHPILKRMSHFTVELVAE